MNKLSIFTFIVIVVVFVGIIVATQSNYLIKPANQIPTLPPEADRFQMISPIPSEAAQVQGQSTQNNQQQQKQQQGGANPTFGVEEGVRASYSATIKTTKGNISIILDGQDAPRTVKNFIQKAKSGFYKNLTFHRIEDWVAQGGDPKGDGTGGGLMQTEMNALPFVEGSLGVARGGNINISNDSQFFITKTDAAWLNQQYTNFGIVKDGMSVVKSLQKGDKILGIVINE